MTGNRLALLLEQEEVEAEEAGLELPCPMCGETPCLLEQDDWDRDEDERWFDEDWCDACQGPCTL